jgi:hypothetical protein
MTDLVPLNEIGHSNPASMQITEALCDTFEEIVRKSR